MEKSLAHAMLNVTGIVSISCEYLRFLIKSASGPVTTGEVLEFVDKKPGGK